MVKKSEEAKDVKLENASDGEHDDQLNEEELKWWEQENLNFAGKGEKRWDTLSHNGVLFPPLYQPHHIPVLYEGTEFHMTPEEEEVATMFAVMKEHDYYRNETFRRNFFRSWREILDKREHPIRRLEFCDFERIYQWHLQQRERKLNRTKEEKLQAKQAIEAEAEPFRFCLWDGRREQVANFRVEPPGLFRGRGKHPLMGKLKLRVQPEDITINIGSEAPIPAPPEGHHWHAVQHDQTVTWLAMWRDSVGGNFKYVMLAPSSTIKGQSDMLKFEKARKLKDHVQHIRESYMKDLRSNDSYLQQRAVAMYFIDVLALRVGNEKSSDEADTVGCCSLRVEHIQMLPNNRVAFDFLGKDSVRYQNEVQLLPEVYTVLARIIRGKRRDADIFDQITPTQLNDHLKSFMDGLSAKVFRTYNASITLDRWFKEKPVDPKASVHDKLTYFNKANTEVAILCNHQKTVSKNFRIQIGQLSTKLGYTKTIIEQLQKAKATMKKGSAEAAVKEFFAEQDRIQNEWLEAYGTEEQKQEYAAIVAKRAAGKVRTSKSGSSKKKTSSGEKKSKTAGGAKKSKSKSSKGAARKKTTAKKGAAKKSSTKTKATTKKPSRKAVKAEDSDDDDIPLSSL